MTADRRSNSISALAERRYRRSDFLDIKARNRSASREMNTFNRFADPIYCIFRLVIGLLFACHGGQKILSFPPGGHGMPTDTLSWIGAIIELVGGFLVAFGFLTRLAAFFAAGEMAVAYFMVHAAGKALNHAPSAVEQFFPLLNKGELAVLYCWCFLFFLFYGPGRWSIDALIGKRRAAAPASAT
jgi:putative oxidoreductase